MHHSTSDRLRHEQGSNLDPSASSEVGLLDLVFGVPAPLVCFGVFISSIGGAITWPLSIYVFVCVAAFVASCLREPREDALDAYLHGALAGAALFALPWGVVCTLLVLTGLTLIGTDPGGVSIALLLGASAPVGAYIYFRRWKRRWPRRARSRAHWPFRVSGALAPAVACSALYFGVATWAERVDAAVASRPAEVDAVALERWRWIAPSFRWRRITIAFEREPELERRSQFDAAHVALTGYRVPRPPGWSEGSLHDQD